MTTSRMPLTPTYAGGVAALSNRPIAGTSARDPFVPYLPETEPLADGAIRATILGSGSPWLTKAQAGGSLLVEVGNDARDLFLFDLGSGALANFSGLRLPMTSLTKLFLSHLHVDHVGDVLSFIGGYGRIGRLDPVEVWGGGAEDPALGVAAFIEHTEKALTWNLASVAGIAPTSGSHATAHAIPIDAAATVYDTGGVTVRSFPVIHGMAGAVGYRLDFAGRSVVFSGDTTPSWTVVDAARDCDLLIHDAALPATVFAEYMQMPLDQAERVVRHGHTTSPAAGLVFAETGPRMAALWHCQVIEGQIEPVFEAVGERWDGPTVLCQDLTVFDIDSDGVTARQARVDPIARKVIGSSRTERHVDSKPAPPSWWADIAMDWEPMLERTKDGT